MGNRYRCQRCGCTLDPGEGKLCDDCRKEIRKEEEQRKYCFITKEAQNEIRMLSGMRGA